jgi:hypothetical protein
MTNIFSCFKISVAGNAFGILIGKEILSFELFHQKKIPFCFDCQKGLPFYHSKPALCWY